MSHHGRKGGKMSQLLFQCKPFVDRFRRRFPEEKGVTAPEYGLMLGLVALAVAFAVPLTTLST
jgi:Flp pilus assembly pilin Flp